MSVLCTTINPRSIGPQVTACSHPDFNPPSKLNIKGWLTIYSWLLTNCWLTWSQIRERLCPQKAVFINVLLSQAMERDQSPPRDERLVLCDVSDLYCVLCITHYRLCPCAREGPRSWSWQLVGATNNQHWPVSRGVRLGALRGWHLNNKQWW